MGRIAIVIQAKNEVLAEADDDAHRGQIVLMRNVDLTIEDVEDGKGVHVRAKFYLLL